MQQINFDTNLINAFNSSNLYEIEEILKREMLQKEKDYRFINNNVLEVFHNNEESWIYLIGQKYSNNIKIQEYIELYLRPSDRYFNGYKVKKLKKKILLTENDLYSFFRSIKKGFDKGYMMKVSTTEDFYYNGEDFFILDFDKLYIKMSNELKLKPSEILYNKSMYFYNDKNDEILFNSKIVGSILNFSIPIINITLPIIAKPIPVVEVIPSHGNFISNNNQVTIIPQSVGIKARQ